MFEITKKFCDSFLEKGLPGFDLAVFQGGKCILRYMNGYSDLENKVKMNGHEKYNIYSCSKVITCTAALQLYEKGLFRLEDRLCDYMPEFTKMTVQTEDGIKEAKNPILIKHLFEMTAGFSYKVTSPELLKCKEQTGGRCPTRETMRYLAKEPLLFEPGQRWQYSLCHDVLAALVEVMSGVRFEDYVKTNIFDVAGMKDSTFMLSDSELDTISEQYRFIDGAPVNVGKQIQNYKLGSEYASGGAGCISTVDDYIKFLEALRTFVLLKPETVKLMMTNRLTEEQSRTYTKKETNGYGLGVSCPLDSSKDSKFGWGGAACAHLLIDMENELSVYLGCHLLSSPVQGVRSMVSRYVDAELHDISKLKEIEKDLQYLHDYNLTY